MTDLARIRAYCSRATPGPWISQPLADDAGYLGYLVVTEDDAPETVQAVAECGFDRPGTNAEFIAQARSDLPAVVAELEAALRAEDSFRKLLAAAATQRDKAEAELEAAKKLLREWVTDRRKYVDLAYETRTFLAGGDDGE